VALVIRFIAGVLPPAILLAVLVWLARVWWRRKRRKLA